MPLWGGPSGVMWGGLGWVFPVLGFAFMVLMMVFCVRMMRGVAGGGGSCDHGAHVTEADELRREVRELREEVQKLRAVRG